MQPVLAHEDDEDRYDDDRDRDEDRYPYERDSDGYRDYGRERS